MTVIEATHYQQYLLIDISLVDLLIPTSFSHRTLTIYFLFLSIEQFEQLLLAVGDVVITQ